MSLAKHGNPNNDEKKPNTKKNPVGFEVKKKGEKEELADTNTDNSTEEVTDTGTDNSTEESTDTNTTKTTEELAAALKAKLGIPDKKPEKHQISAWIDPKVYKEFKKYKGNGDRGQKSELVNNLLKIYFGIED